MKRIISVFIVIGIILALCSCGNESEKKQNDTNPSSGDSSLQTGNPSDETSSKDKDSFSSEFEFLGYKFAYPADFVCDNSDGGKMLLKGNAFSITVDAPDYYGFNISGESYEGLAEACKEPMVKAMEGRYYDLFSAGSTSISIDSEKKIMKNDIEMVHIKGKLTNTLTDKEVDYIGYLFISELNGTRFPFFMTGIPRDGSISELEGYMNQQIEHISK